MKFSISLSNPQRIGCFGPDHIRERFVMWAGLNIWVLEKVLL